MGADEDKLGGRRPDKEQLLRKSFDSNQLVSLAGLKAERWKNGGGVTYQIVADPPDATAENFRWRVSRAVIEKDGPFSAFPDVARWITLISGPGFTLDFADGTSFDVVKPFTAFWFDGAGVTQCRLKEGRAAIVLNVMARNDVVMRVNVATSRAALPTAGHAIVSAFGAAVRLDERHVLTAAVDRPF